jgi:hypothetical protein
MPARGAVAHRCETPDDCIVISIGGRACGGARRLPRRGASGGRNATLDLETGDDSARRRASSAEIAGMASSAERQSSAALELSLDWSAARPRQLQRVVRRRWRVCYVEPARVAKSARSLTAVTGSARVADFSATSAPRPITRAATPCSATRSSPKAPSGHSARPSRSGV